MYGQTIIVGNLGNDPEMRYTPQGSPVCNFSVATNRRWKNQDGSDGEETTWFRCSVWNKTAEAVNQYLSKGRQVFIVGRLIPDKDTGGPRVWTGNDGKAHASFELHVETIKFLGSATNGGSAKASEPAPLLDEPPF